MQHHGGTIIMEEPWKNHGRTMEKKHGRIMEEPWKTHIKTIEEPRKHHRSTIKET
jgi:hypothetical protein